MTIPDPPPGLLAAGEVLWRNTWSEYVLDPAETAVLTEMCHLTDNLATMQAQLAGLPPTAAGSRGQIVVHPLIAEIRLTSLALAKLAKTLALPHPRTAAANRRGRIPGVTQLRKDA
jgi:hypothetical protein